MRAESGGPKGLLPSAVLLQSLGGVRVICRELQRMGAVGPAHLLSGSTWLADRQHCSWPGEGHTGNFSWRSGWDCYREEDPRPELFAPGVRSL